MRVDAFDFDLPEDRIAQRPARPRDSARLLHVTPERLDDCGMRDLPRLLRPGDLLVFNDTKVIPARLAGMRREVPISVTLHQAVPEAGDGHAVWRSFAKPAKRLKPGDEIVFASDFQAEVLSRDAAGDVVLRFDRDPAALAHALARHGAVPLPPYIRGGLADEADLQDYQTLFARQPGAVAAPTAALHFTPELMAELDAAGVAHRFVTLHVGAGTFLPVKVEDISAHVMHAETGSLTAETAACIAQTRARGGRVIAVGTTSLRLLEAAADETGAVRPFAGETRIFIAPGYRFRAVDLLITNFHLPRSTLFMLVAAFAGLDRMKAAYAHAIRSGYRFYSYGDACLLEQAQAPEQGP